ncbi:MAG: ATP-dependent metallopeptidase FtsH/Yme1/Tma family protein, partial [Muribaculaceae bacterium]|nr:ATP-dependent metallopeptidase FtsH/Yme1/Tma family protein [Muribaculaceae bacterium]
MSNDSNKGKKFSFQLNMYWMYLIIFLILGGIYFFQQNEIEKKVNWTEFQQYVEQGGVKEITVFSNKREAEAIITDSLAQKLFYDNEFTPGKGTTAKIVAGIPSTETINNAAQQWRDSGVFTGSIEFTNASDYSGMFWTVAPVLLLIFFWIFMFRRMSGGGAGPGGGNVFSVGKAKAQLFDKDNDKKVTFNDVAGLSEAKTEVAEIVQFLKDPKSYTNLGGRIPKGALLV